MRGTMMQKQPGKPRLAIEKYIFRQSFECATSAPRETYAFDLQKSRVEE